MIIIRISCGVVPRIARPRLLSLIRQFPVVAILGPQQAGKSTLAKRAFSGSDRFDLEDPAAFSKSAEDPLFFMGESKRIVIDEVQRLPELFPVLRGYVVNSSEGASWAARGILACGLKRLLTLLKLSPSRA